MRKQSTPTRGGCSFGRMQIESRRRAGVILTTLSLSILSGCSLKGMALNAVANSLSGGGSGVFLTDDDPVLVGEALPTNLKLMESVLQETPAHEGLLVATASGFVMYAHGWVLRSARALESTNLAAGRRERERAKRLFLRARGYAGRALELRHPGVTRALSGDPGGATSRLTREDLPAMYWYAAALGSALSADKNDMQLLADLPVVTAILERSLTLDEGWNRGAAHELMMVVSASQPTGAGGGPAVAEGHFRRAVQLNDGATVGIFVSFAETVCVQRQDREVFLRYLDQALAFDPDLQPDTRLANLIAQEHARWLLTRVDELFIQDPEEAESGLLLHGGLFPWPVER